MASGGPDPFGANSSRIIIYIINYYLTVIAWCIIGLLGVLLIRSFGFREFHQEKIIPWLVGIAMIFFLIALMFN